LLAIPNGTVATINVENLSRRDKILFKTVLGLHTDTSADHLRYVLAEIRSVLSGNKKVESDTIRVRLMELTATAINIELLCYVLTRDFNEFAEVREELLLQIMKFVEESGTALAQPSQTLYLSPDPASKDAGSKKEKLDTAVKKITGARDEQRPPSQNLPGTKTCRPPSRCFAGC
jgi:MscS family membrane protein